MSLADLQPAPVLGNQGDLAAARGVHGREETLAVCRQAATEREVVAGVVAAEDGARERHPFEDHAQLLERLLGGGELEEALRQAKQDLWGARFALSTRQLKDYSTIPLTRRTIARILTVQHERKLGQTA